MNTRTRRNWCRQGSLLITLVLVVAACSPTSGETTTTTGSTSTLAPITTSSGVATTTAPATTTTTRPVVTTTTQPATTTQPPTTVAPATTTTTVAEGNEPPSIEIISPGNLSSHIAAFDTDQSDFGAHVALSAVVSDADGDPVTVAWSSSVQGDLGSGESIVAFISTSGTDVSQPIITAIATDAKGASTSESVQIVVWIPSDA